jgi:hypothetical protein
LSRCNTLTLTSRSKVIRGDNIRVAIAANFMRNCTMKEFKLLRSSNGQLHACNGQVASLDSAVMVDQYMPKTR